MKNSSFRLVDTVVCVVSISLTQCAPVTREMGWSELIDKTRTPVGRTGSVWIPTCSGQLVKNYRRSYNYTNTSHNLFNNKSLEIKVPVFFIKWRLQLILLQISINYSNAMVDLYCTKRRLLCVSCWLYVVVYLTGAGWFADASSVDDFRYFPNGTVYTSIIFFILFVYISSFSGVTGWHIFNQVINRVVERDLTN